MNPSQNRKTMTADVIDEWPIVVLTEVVNCLCSCVFKCWKGVFFFLVFFLTIVFLLKILKSAVLFLHEEILISAIVLKVNLKHCLIQHIVKVNELKLPFSLLLFSYFFPCMLIIFSFSLSRIFGTFYLQALKPIIDFDLNLTQAE